VSTPVTIEPDTIRVASAFPDPPFDMDQAGQPGGFDEELMQAICKRLGYAWKLTRFTGANFNDIFDGLEGRTLDAVISGTTITPDRAARVLFSEPYLEFNQGLAVNTVRTPHIAGPEGLKGQTVGIQIGNTSDIVARKLLAEGAIADIRYYPYDGIGAALDDLSAGSIAAVIKLHPVIAWLVRGRPGLAVVAEFPTHEKLGIAFRKDNAGLCSDINGALAGMKADGSFAALQRKWIPPGMAL
jgi:polar amino acid transport system substrate-binding protein